MIDDQYGICRDCDRMFVRVLRDQIHCTRCADIRVEKRHIFRGKGIEGNKRFNIKKGEWVHGYYLVDVGKHWIVELNGRWNEVDPATVGMFTGKKDDEGVEMFAGDRVKVTFAYKDPNSEHETATKQATGDVRWCSQALWWTFAGVPFIRIRKIKVKSATTTPELMEGGG